MKLPFQSEPVPPTLIHHFDEVFGVKIPLPALQRGWLHGRELTQAWHVERIAETLGDPIVTYCAPIALHAIPALCYAHSS